MPRAGDGNTQPRGGGDRGLCVPHLRVGGCRPGGGAPARWGGPGVLYREQVFQCDVSIMEYTTECSYE